MIINGYNPQVNIRTDNLSQPDSAALKNQDSAAGGEQSPLSNLSGGDTLSGRIVSREGDRVNISLGGDSQITARLDTAAELPVGSTVTFTVLNSDRSGITLSPLLTNTDTSSPVNTALMNAGIQLDARNADMVRSMMEYGMPVGKDELLGMSNMLKDVPAADINSAVVLTHMGIEPTPDNIAQFDSYLNYEHQISEAVNEIMDLMPDAVNDLVSSGNTMEAINMSRDMLQIFTDQGTYLSMSNEELALSGMETPVSMILSPAELAEFSDLLTQNGIDEAFGQSLANGEISLRDALFLVNDIVGEVAEGDNPQVANEASQMPEGAAEEMSGASRTASAGASIEDIPLPTKGDQASVQGTPNNETKESSGSVGLDFLNSLKSDAVKADTLDHAADVARQFNKHEQTRAVLDLITSKPLSSLLKEAVGNEWKLSPRQVGEEKQVEDLYKRITEQTNRLINTLNEHAGKNTPLAESMNELNKNMNFMNELNNMFNYVQLPLKLSESDAHGELYVYSNKKHMASSDGNVSALLHLDMDHLGATDVYVTMNAQNHVNTHFYLPDDEALDLIAAHIDELNARIEARGYTCSAKVDRREEMTNVMAEMVEDDKPAIPVSISNFDARA